MLWWLSFADPDKPKGTQFLGVAVVEADDFFAAHRKTWDLKINPGGEIQAYSMEKDPEEYTKRIPLNQLLSKEKLKELDLI